MIQNNSPEMKTIVETFLIEETIDLIHDNEKLEAWKKHVEELGLEGQKSIVKAEKSPIPFMHLKVNLLNTIRTLCPVEVDVEKYNITPIPVEILDLIALSRREGYFTEIKICYDDKSPDPFCIGIKKMWGNWQNRIYNSLEEAKAAGLNISSYDYSSEHYLIGKWADVKHSFEELIEMAKKRFISQKTAEYKQDIKNTQRKLEDVETEAFNQFNGGNILTSSLPF